MDILILYKDVHFNESLVQILFTLGRLKSTSIFNLGSTSGSNPILSDSVIISSILGHSSTSNGLFGSFEREESRGEESSGEESRGE